MKKTLIVAVACVAALFIVAPSLHAQADVIKEFGCALTSHNLDPDPGTLFTDEKTHATTTPSGNTVLTCHFDIPEGFAPAKAVRNGGFNCSTPGGGTTNSSSVATPGGKATLKCQINPSE